MKKSIFKKKLSKREFFSVIFLLPVRKILNILSERFLAKDYKQIAIPAFDYISNEISIQGIFEKNQLDTFFEWISELKLETEKSICLDIGANIGNHSLYFSRYFEKVLSFEPNPFIFSLLRINSKLVNNIDCYNVGCSNESGKAYLNTVTKNLAGSFVTAESAPESNEIELIVLDNLLEDLDNIKLLKIDVEGHEYKALSGAKNLIKRNKPIILFEQQKEEIKDNSSPTIDLLRGLGYKKFAILSKFPRIKSKSAILKAIFEPILVSILGNSLHIELHNEFEPNFYEFIIALPNWIFEKQKI